jgi:hypothetical protein
LADVFARTVAVPPTPTEAGTDVNAMNAAGFGAGVGGAAVGGGGTYGAGVAGSGSAGAVETTVEALAAVGAPAGAALPRGPPPGAGSVQLATIRIASVAARLNEPTGPQPIRTAPHLVLEPERHVRPAHGTVKCQ